MISAGLEQLKKLESNFIKLDENKHPKMLIVCEEQEVIQKVEDYLIETKGLTGDDILSIHSNKKNEVGADEYEKIKNKLFQIDNHKTPKVIISVLMLREGFDVSNICVIVPLRASESRILIEQTIGRGLRLMWRGGGINGSYDDMRKENLRIVRSGGSPDNAIDRLSIIEHPNFLQFYNDMIKNGEVTIDGADGDSSGGVGDMIKITLKKDYERYAIPWLQIISDTQETESLPLHHIALEPFTQAGLDELITITGEQEVFVETDARTDTRIDEIEVEYNLFSIGAYNEYLRTMCEMISGRLEKTTTRIQTYLQNHQHSLMARLDAYIKTELFGSAFDWERHWRVLCVQMVADHIKQTFSRAISLYETQNRTKIAIEPIDFSCVDGFTHRAKYTLEGTKTIYTHTPYPANKGGLEKRFTEWILKDSSVVAFIKILESKHTFACVPYIDDKGKIRKYFADFIIACDEGVYIIETKAQKDIKDSNVLYKKKAALAYIDEINTALSQENIHSLLIANYQHTLIKPNTLTPKSWGYFIVGENDMDSIQARGGGFMDLIAHCSIYDKPLKR